MTLDFIGPDRLLASLGEFHPLTITSTTCSGSCEDLTRPVFPLPVPPICRKHPLIDLEPLSSLVSPAYDHLTVRCLWCYEWFYLELLCKEARLLPEGWLEVNDAVRLGIVREDHFFDLIVPPGDDDDWNEDLQMSGREEYEYYRQEQRREMALMGPRGPCEPFPGGGWDYWTAAQREEAERLLTEGASFRVQGPWLGLTTLLTYSPTPFFPEELSIEFTHVPFYAAASAPRTLTQCAMEDLRSLSVLSAPANKEQLRQFQLAMGRRYLQQWPRTGRWDGVRHERLERVRQRLLAGWSPARITEWLVDKGWHPLKPNRKRRIGYDETLESARVTVQQIKRQLRKSGDLSEDLPGDSQGRPTLGEGWGG